LRTTHHEPQVIAGLFDGLIQAIANGVSPVLHRWPEFPPELASILTARDSYHALGLYMAQGTPLKKQDRALLHLSTLPVMIRGLEKQGEIDKLEALLGGLSDGLNERGLKAETKDMRIDLHSFAKNFLGEAVPVDTGLDDEVVIHNPQDPIESKHVDHLFFTLRRGELILEHAHGQRPMMINPAARYADELMEYCNGRGLLPPVHPRGGSYRKDLPDGSHYIIGQG